ncbi:PTS sugar transporter subunit IIC [Enterococcus plantarum]|uniref:PTS sugar transporter subunit IIC n=1 Tax=Enterococcus plantarum TaxID=1077675 RepID=UPI001A8F9E5E|nr:PTS transporter subunit EIIC [Enterococcus plantarum]MBO0468575.1 PTS sugar transporter subunit IIC [Enterococcus plantarum]
MSETKKSSFINGLNVFVNKFSNNTFVKSIANGMMMTLPITIVGSLTTIIGMIPGLPEIVLKACSLGTSISSNLITIYVIIGISCAMAREKKGDTIASIILSLATFFVLTPITAFDIGKEKPVLAFELTYLGSKGIFVGMIVALVVTWIFAKMVEKRITFRMPDSVPTAIAKTFEAIVPAAIIFIVAIVISTAFAETKFGNIHDFIYTNLQTPLEALGGSVWSALFIMFLSELLWFFGIHGSMVVSSVIAVLFTTQAYANMEAVAAGEAATNIINSFFLDAFKGPRALALAVILVWMSRSEKFKSIGKISLVPSIFGITEPMKFGIPMIMNAVIFIPLTLSAAVCVGIAYLATIIGFLPVISVNVPKNLPTFLSGFMAAGWQGLVVQLIQFVVVLLLYLPFMKKLDSQGIAEETANLEKL